MWTTTFEGYFIKGTQDGFRVEREPTYPDWVEQSANPEYEKHLWDADPHNN